MVTENRVRGGLFGTSLRRARVFKFKKERMFRPAIRHASTVYISSRASWASRRRSIRIGRLAASSSRRGSRGGRPLRVQDGVFYRLSFGFDR